MLLDSNIVSSFLKPNAAERFPAVERFVREVLENRNIAISYVTQFELRRGVEELVLKGQKAKAEAARLGF